MFFIVAFFIFYCRHIIEETKKFTNGKSIHGYLGADFFIREKSLNDKHK